MSEEIVTGYTDYGGYGKTDKDDAGALDIDALDAARKLLEAHGREKEALRKYLGADDIFMFSATSSDGAIIKRGVGDKKGTIYWVVSTFGERLAHRPDFVTEDREAAYDYAKSLSWAPELMRVTVSDSSFVGARRRFSEHRLEFMLQPTWDLLEARPFDGVVMGPPRPDGDDEDG